jgi:predicted porin
MIRRLMMFAAVVAAVLLAAPSWSAIEFFGTAKVKPTYYSNFDFDDSTNDTPIINEGGLAKGGHLRAELRLGWKAQGDKWSVKMITEADIIMNKNNVDRSYYVGGADKNGWNPNTGGEFGIERAEMLYKFAPQLELETGWDIRALDIKSGGLLFGDDHPFIGFRGQLAENTKYELLYLPIQNMNDIKNDPIASDSMNDWGVYTLKINQQVGSFNLSPFIAYSDNDAWSAQVTYYGFEMTGKAGKVKPSFEIVMADGDFDNGKDISSWAAYAGVEMDVCKGFTPYVAVRYTQGDDDANDDDVEGWVGITDIGRFTPLMGMDGGILSEDLGQSYGATLYSYSPERSPLDTGLATDNYGGISNGGRGNNPGQMLLAFGAKGDLSSMVDKLSYKTQIFMIWYDETDNLKNIKNPGTDVDDYAGTTFDLQLKYALDKNFSVDYIFGVFVPGDGIEDQYGDDTAMTNCLSLSWTY